MSLRTAHFSLALVGLLSCGGPSPSPFAAPCMPAMTDAESRQLLLDFAAVDGCRRLQGTFLPLPAVGISRLGAPLTSGRWLVEHCSPSLDRGALAMTITGPAWQWVDQVEFGHRVSQYVYFRATVQLRGEVAAKYDPNRHVASIWLMPIGGAVDAQVQPLGDVSANPESPFAAIFGGVLSVVSRSPDERARAAVSDMGSKLFRDALGGGATITLNTSNEQWDFQLGRLAPGVVPARPFVGDKRWLVNEVQVLHRGGVSIAGPFELTSRVMLDAVVERGRGAVGMLACAGDSEREIAARTPFVVEPGSPFARPLVPPACRWLLVTAARDDETTVAFEIRTGE